MKKGLFAISLVALLLSLTLGSAMAGFGMEDPALCVAGQWLIVNAANEGGVRISIPDGVPYGFSNDSGCGDLPDGLNAFTGDVLKTRSGGKIALVHISGKQASTPSVSVDYGNFHAEKSNNGKQNLIFQVPLP